MSLIAQKLISASGAKGDPVDPDFNLVTQLYQFDGSNGAQNNTFTGVGASGASQSWTRNGSTTQGSFSPFSAEEGKWSVEFPGGGTSDQSRIALGSTNEYVFGTGDFTIEAWIFPKSILAYSDANFVLDFRNGNAGYNIELYMFIASQGGTNNLYGTVGQSSGGITVGAWNHIAISRASGTQKGFINGVEKFSASDTANHQYSGSGVNIGNRYASNWNPFDGNISNLRIVKGTAVYTGNFTPSTSPLTNVTNTVNLGLRSNRFVDSVSSVVPYLNTTSGPIKIQPFSPFAPSAAYDAAVNGGSGHFDDATGDTLSISDSSLAIGTSDFTIEGWYYFDGNHSAGVGLFQQGDGLNGPALGWWPGGSPANGWQFYYGSGTWVHATGATARMFEWTHIAFVRSSNVSNLYVNGVKATSDVSDSYNYTSTVFEIGQFYSAGYEMEGYISNFKMCLNAIYTSNFTPPTALVTPTSGGSSAASTKILVDFTNAAMFDQTGKTNLLTVGNTQLDTSIKKFGTASAKFDESGDTATIKDSLYLGSGDFTIEGFVYFNSSPTDGQGLFVFDSQSLGNRAGYGPALGTYAHAPYAGKWHSYYGTQASAGTGTQGNSEATPSATTWIHFAYVRTSGVIKIFIDGSQIGSDIAFTGNYKANNVLTLGGYYSTSYLLGGNLDSWRVTLKARYTSNFTAPTKEFPNLQVSVCKQL